MQTHFIFASNPLRSTVVEDMFADEFGAIQHAGFSASLCPDSVIQDSKPLRNIPIGATIVYRGWMLNATEYHRLAQAIESASGRPFTSPTSYLAAHHLPNWYPLIAEFTPETRVFSLTEN